jgi:hypothetical protein
MEMAQITLGKEARGRFEYSFVVAPCTYGKSFQFVDGARKFPAMDAGRASR